MQATTITSRTLRIDGMIGDACVQKVADALGGVAGVTTESVEVGSATIGADDAGSESACTAIAIAGFKAHDTACTDSGKDLASIAAANCADQKFRDESAALNPKPTGNPVAAPQSGCCGSETTRSIGIGPAATVPANI